MITVKPLSVCLTHVNEPIKQFWQLTVAELKKKKKRICTLVRSRMIRAEECWIFLSLFSIHTASSASSCLVLFHPFHPFSPPSTFLIFSPMLCTLLQKGFGHELFCWLNIFPPLTVYPFAPSRFPLFILPSLSSSFPPSIPIASEFPDLSPPILLFSASSFPLPLHLSDLFSDICLAVSVQ